MRPIIVRSIGRALATCDREVHFYGLTRKLIRQTCRQRQRHSTLLSGGFRLVIPSVI
jgi:hypothetical protein